MSVINKKGNLQLEYTVKRTYGQASKIAQLMENHALGSLYEIAYLKKMKT